jgi:deazaflavin-dependent oxidoreductase (nitroreductase family)
MAVAHSAANKRRGMLSATRVFNRFIMPFAGTRLVPLYGVMTHYGRRSGKAYRTPVVVRPTGDGFIVPMPWGLGTDWFRNVSAAGECRIRWKGRDYDLVQPEVIDSATAATAFSDFNRAAMDRFGIKQCLRLRFRSTQ